MQLVIIYQIILIAQVPPRGGAASGDPPYPRPIHPFTNNNLLIQNMNLRTNSSFTMRLQNVQHLDRCANRTIKEAMRKTDTRN